MSSKFLYLVVVCMMITGFCGTAVAAEAVYKNIDGEWVAFDHVLNPNYTESNANDVIYYPGTDSPAFYVSYQDVMNGSGYGFDDASLGTERRARVVDALNYIASLMINENGSADIHFNPSQSDGTGYLASCGALFWVQNGFAGGFVYDHIKTGVDPLGGQPDATATVDFGYNWYSGTGSPGGSQHDFWSVMLHEITHALGFSSLIDPPGISSITGGNPGAFSYYDTFLYNGNGAPFCNGAGGASYIGNASDLIGGNNGVVFSGSSTIYVYGGDVDIYAPNPFEDGSSISHWDLVPSSSVMLPSISAGVTRRQYEDFEIAALSDLGYNVGNVTGVPTTGTIGLMALLGIVGLLIGKKRKK